MLHLPIGLLGVIAIALASCNRQAAPTDGYANVGGSRFYYQLYGDLGSAQTPLVVLHGAYMSSAAMAPFIRPFVGNRPVIALDARGHGRTGDLPGRFSYEQLADDTAAVLNALNVKRADVLGYSMGAVTAIKMAVRHPTLVGKQIVLSGTFSRAGWYPEVNEVLAQATPDAFAGTLLESEYKRLSPTPTAFPKLVSDIRALDAANYDSSDDDVRRIAGKTMIVLGDADSVQLEHAIALFRLRGGGDTKVAVEGFMTDAPRARLAVLPGTAHIGMVANADVIGQLAIPFLDDRTPTTPPGFLPEKK